MSRVQLGRKCVYLGRRYTTHSSLTSRAKKPSPERSLHRYETPDSETCTRSRKSPSRNSAWLFHRQKKCSSSSKITRIFLNAISSSNKLCAKGVSMKRGWTSSKVNFLLYAKSLRRKSQSQKEIKK